MRRVVLFFESHSASFNGAQQSLFLLVTELDKRRFEAIFLGPAEGELPRRLRAAGIETIILPPTREIARYGGAILREGLLGKGRLLVPYIKYACRIAQILKHKNVDIVHCNSIRSLLTMAPAARFRQVPLIWHLRLNLELGPWNWVGERLADRIIVVADSLRREFPAGPGDPNKFIVVPNGVDPSPFQARFDRLHARKELGIEPDWKVVGTVGSITERKGHHILLQAAAKIAKDFSRTKFVIVGRPEDGRDEGHAAKLRGYVDSLALREKVIFVGWSSDMARVLSAFDLFVLPSFNEGLPRVILEAMASSLPVVATNVGGNAELVVNGQTGFLIPAREPVALAAAVEEILGDPQTACKMGNAGRRLVEERFSLRAAAMGVERIIDELLSGNNHQELAAGTG